MDKHLGSVGLADAYMSHFNKDEQIALLRLQIKNLQDIIRELVESIHEESKY